MLILQKYTIRFNESSLPIAVDSAEKYLKEKFAKELLINMSSFPGVLKCVKYFIKKIMRAL